MLVSSEVGFEKPDAQILKRALGIILAYLVICRKNLISQICCKYVLWYIDDNITIEEIHELV